MSAAMRLVVFVVGAMLFVRTPDSVAADVARLCSWSPAIREEARARLLALDREAVPALWKELTGRACRCRPDLFENYKQVYARPFESDSEITCVMGPPAVPWWKAAWNRLTAALNRP